jgi:hypothetical protein
MRIVELGIHKVFSFFVDITSFAGLLISEPDRGHLAVKGLDRIKLRVGSVFALKGLQPLSGREYDSNGSMAVLSLSVLLGLGKEARIDFERPLKPRYFP